MGLLYSLCKVLKHVTNENEEVRYTFCYDILLNLKTKDEILKPKLYFTFHLSELGADPGFVAPESCIVLGGNFYEK